MYSEQERTAFCNFFPQRSLLMQRNEGECFNVTCFLSKAVQLAFSNKKISALLNTNENNVFFKENALISNIQSIFNMNTLIFLQK